MISSQAWERKKQLSFYWDCWKALKSLGNTFACKCSFRLGFALLSRPPFTRLHCLLSYLAPVHLSTYIERSSLRTTGAIIIRMTYGYVVDPRPGQDPLIRLVASGVDLFSESTVPGRYLVDIVPICTLRLSLFLHEPLTCSPVKYVPAWFPGAGFKTLATEWRKKMMEMCEVPYQMVRENIVRSFPHAAYHADFAALG
jgi:hypothetical protein